MNSFNQVGNDKPTIKRFTMESVFPDVCPNTNCSGNRVEVCYSEGGDGSGYQVLCRDCSMMGPLGSTAEEGIELWNGCVLREG